MMLSWMGLDVSSVGKFAMSTWPSVRCLHLSVESLYSSMESDIVVVVVVVVVVVIEVVVVVV